MRIEPPRSLPTTKIAEPRRDRCCGSSRRAARRSFQIPRVVRRSIHRVVGLQIARSTGTFVAPIRTAPAPNIRSTAAAFRGAFESLSAGIPHVHRMSRYAKALLHVDGDSMKHPERFPPRERLVSLLGLRECVFFQLISESVESRDCSGRCARKRAASARPTKSASCEWLRLPATLKQSPVRGRCTGCGCRCG